MNSQEQLATEQQLNCLHEFGYVPEANLTKSRAAELIHTLRSQVHEQRPADESKSENQACHLRTVQENARRALAEAEPDEVRDLECEVEAAKASRREFWVDTCREVTRRRTSLPQVIEFHSAFGCRFEEPTHEQVQEILEALDTTVPDWERGHPELFYQTLELNFAELLKR